MIFLNVRDTSNIEWDINVLQITAVEHSEKYSKIHVTDLNTIQCYSEESAIPKDEKQKGAVAQREKIEEGILTAEAYINAFLENLNPSLVEADDPASE